ncbi:hypothetical protein GPY61_31965 [Massilia sp. NEAU-DD11]|uniref:Uncharacterized protein n=1 Tax=Massilia cellulosiltytica TaxID=2683234 RepID=A0A7X3G6I9_9BURK|nr:hypothetical protein [Telluria cellulosilytica]MVW64539.1 hypothetical protein [Telluria cellulosilytica]
MSNRDKDQGVDLDAQLQAAAGPTHRPFSRLDPGATSRGAVFIESVADMCAGLQTCLQLVHSTDLAVQARAMDDDEPAPSLGVVDRERLLRLAIAVTGALASGAQQEIEWINAQAPKRAAGQEASK